MPSHNNMDEISAEIAPFLPALRLIVDRLAPLDIDWVVTGSLGMALQGMPVAVGDIDLQTNASGAYEIERELQECVVEPITFSAADRIRSHFGKLQVQGVAVEVMGDVQKRIDARVWEAPVDVARHRLWTTVAELTVPVLSLAYEADAYRRLGRDRKATLLRKWLDQQR